MDVNVLLIIWIFWSFLNAYFIYKWVNLEKYLNKSAPFTFLNHVYEIFLYVSSFIFYLAFSIHLIIQITTIKP